jgi:hypothetical protein
VWNVRTEVVPVTTVAGTCNASKPLINLSNIRAKHDIKELQKRALFGSTYCGK